MRRVASSRTVAIQVLFMLASFKGSIGFEGIHPLETGLLRRRTRRDRRPGMPVEPVWRFYPKYWSETAIKLFQWAGLFLQLGRSYRAIRRDPNHRRHTDLATTPVRARRGRDARTVPDRRGKSIRRTRAAPARRARRDEGR